MFILIMSSAHRYSHNYLDQFSEEERQREEEQQREEILYSSIFKRFLDYNEQCASIILILLFGQHILQLLILFLYTGEFFLHRTDLRMAKMYLYSLMILCEKFNSKKIYCAMT